MIMLILQFGLIFAYITYMFYDINFKSLQTNIIFYEYITNKKILEDILNKDEMIVIDNNYINYKEYEKQFEKG